MTAASSSTTHAPNGLGELLTAGGLGLSDGEVRVSPPDPAWPLAFVALREQIRPAVAGARIAHIGSTGVAGLAAKPIIDISVGLPPGRSLDAEPARASGLVFRAVNPEAVLFALYAHTGLRMANVHVRARDSASERWDLLWRDFLRAHPEERAGYAAAKADAAAGHRVRPAYSAAKGRFISEASGRAAEWAARTGWVAGEE